MPADEKSKPNPPSDPNASLPTEESGENQPKDAPPKPVPFPWGMFSLAALFDLIGVIPVINFFSETLAGLIFAFWQKKYVPQTDPLTTFLIAKIIDTVSLGLLPSNIGIVCYAYIKKKAAVVAQTRLGKYATGKLKNQEI